MTRALRGTGLAAALLAAGSGPAEAHIVAARLGDFYAGALHPLTDLQDIVLWTALGLLAGSLGAARARWAMLAVPLGLIAGLGASLVLGGIAVGAAVSALAMVLLGLLLAARVRLPGTALWGLAFGLALLRGAVNASGVAPETDLALFAAGLGTVGYAVMALIMALTVTFLGAGPQAEVPWRGIAVRVCGSWIAAIGLMVGGFALIA